MNKDRTRTIQEHSSASLAASPCATEDDHLYCEQQICASHCCLQVSQAAMVGLYLAMREAPLKSWCSLHMSKGVLAHGSPGSLGPHLAPQVMHAASLLPCSEACCHAAPSGPERNRGRTLGKMWKYTEKHSGSCEK